MLLRVVKIDRLLELMTSFDRLSEKFQSESKSRVRPYQQDRVIKTSGLNEQLFRRPPSRVVLSPYQIVKTQTQIVLAGFTELLAQLERPEQTIFRFRGGITRGDHQCGAESYLHPKLLPGAFDALRHRVKQIQTAARDDHRFFVGAHPQGILSGERIIFGGARKLPRGFKESGQLRRHPAALFAIKPEQRLGYRLAQSGLPRRAQRAIESVQI